jgi:hypothetical protein
MVSVRMSVAEQVPLAQVPGNPPTMLPLIAKVCAVPVPVDELCEIASV